MRKMIANIVSHRAGLAIQIVGDGDGAEDFQGLGGRLGPLEDEADDSAKIHSMRFVSFVFRGGSSHRECQRHR